ncbi:hypothetical protein [Nonomuraea sp. B1E8]|uniref:hypothetical protein n=1 Tax=unclassified Nonomuraea TaxID=2593643 RepID=UPI00325D10E2
MTLANESDALADQLGRGYVESLQRRLPDWWLMYSPYGRSLVAFYRGPCAQGGIRVEAEHPEELLRLMGDAIQAQWKTQPGLTRDISTDACRESPSGPQKGTAR